MTWTKRTSIFARCEHEYVIDASMDLDDFNELLSVDLPTEESDTLGGFIYGQLGRCPESRRGHR